MVDVHNDAAHGHYVLETEGATAIAAYRRDGDTVVFTHTEVPAAMQGQGIGSALAAGALADVRRAGWHVVPQCPFVAANIDRHPEDVDLLAG